jgi:hypothetical protein
VFQAINSIQKRLLFLSLLGLFFSFCTNADEFSAFLESQQTGDAFLESEIENHPDLSACEGLKFKTVREQKIKSEKCVQNTDLQGMIPGNFFELSPLNDHFLIQEFSRQLLNEMLVMLKTNAHITKQMQFCLQQDGTWSGPPYEGKKCSDVLKQQASTLQMNVRKARLYLAQAKDEEDHLAVNVTNVLRIEPKIAFNFSQSALSLMPDAVAGHPLTEREKNEVIRRHQVAWREIERQSLKISLPLRRTWLAQKRMQMYEDNEEKYKELVYSEVPLLSLLPRPQKWQEDIPFWDKSELLQAWKKIEKNIIQTQKVVAHAKSQNVFEHSKPRAALEWIKGFLPFIERESDLIAFFKRKEFLNNFLKDKKHFCGLANTILRRLDKINLQNFAAVGVANFSLPIIGKSLSRLGTTARWLSGAQANMLVSGSVSTLLLVDAQMTVRQVHQELSGLSGLVAGEGKMRAFRELNQAEDYLLGAAIFFPLDLARGWTVGKVLYGKLAQKMKKDMPELEVFFHRATGDEKLRDALVDKWLEQKFVDWLRNLPLSTPLTPTQSVKLRSLVGQQISQIAQENPELLLSKEVTQKLFSLSLKQLNISDSARKDVATLTQQLARQAKNWTSSTSAENTADVFWNLVTEATEKGLALAAQNPLSLKTLTKDAQARQKFLHEIYESHPALKKYHTSASKNFSKECL